MIKISDGGKKPDIEMEDNMVTNYDICSEYGHSDEFFDFLYDNCHFDKSAGEVEGVDLPKDASFFEDALYEGASSMGYDNLNEKHLFAEGKAYYDPFDREMQEKLIKHYIGQQDDDYYD